MPNYAYRCLNCEHRLVVFQQMADDPLEDCPACATGMLQRSIGALGLPGVKIKNQGEGYQPGLARRPNDPQAWVDSPRALNKLIDKRRRAAEKQGINLRVGKASDLMSQSAPPEPPLKTLEQFIQEERGT